MVSIIGNISYELFRNSSNDMAVQQYKVKSFEQDDEGYGREQNRIICKGYGLPKCMTIDYCLTGEWEHHPKYGWQINVKNYEEVVKMTRQGVINYLSNGPISGIGKSLAERIYDAFGLESVDVLNNEPERLREVRGIGKQKLATIVRSQNENRITREISALLMPYGIEASLCVKIGKRFGVVSMDIINGDTWRLMEVQGVSFPICDKIVRSLGKDLRSDERVEAGIDYALLLHESSGSLATPYKELIRLATRVLGPEVPVSQIENAVSRLCWERKVWNTTVEDLGIVIYRDQAFKAESTLSRRLAEMQLLGGTIRADSKKTDQLIRELEDSMGCTYSEEQKQAIRLSVSSPVLVLTGGPGTGKTTVVNGICKVNTMLKPKTTFCLLSPTGKAASRMKEATGMDAHTVDSVLLLQQNNGFFQEKVEEIEADITICDESSMLDTYKAASLMLALKDGHRIIFVGDIDQLPSVGPGAFLRDLIGSGSFPVVKLARVYRQKGGAEENAIVENAYRINSGNTELLNSSNFHFCETSRDERIEEKIRIAYRHYVKEYGKDNVVCLLPTKKTERVGTFALNRDLQEDINPEGRSVDFMGKILREGDLVMNTQNDPDKGLINGDIGYITSVSRIDGAISVTAEFDHRSVSFIGDEELKRLTHAYAMTIHKSQGSEYDCVIIGLSEHIGTLMEKRNLIYTAVTRAKKMCLVIGSRDVLNRCILTQDSSKRITSMPKLVAKYTAVCRSRQKTS